MYAKTIENITKTTIGLSYKPHRLISDDILWIPTQGHTRGQSNTKEIHTSAQCGLWMPFRRSDELHQKYQISVRCWSPLSNQAEENFLEIFGCGVKTELRVLTGGAVEKADRTPPES